MSKLFTIFQGIFNTVNRFIKTEAMLFAFLVVLLCTNIAYLKTAAHNVINIKGATILLENQVAENNHMPEASNFSIWLLLAMLAAFGGFLQALITTNKKGYGFLISMAGIISLLMLQVSLPDLNKNLSVQYTWTYWAILIFFALAGSLSYLKRQNNTGQVRQDTGKALNINIVTTKPNKENGQLKDNEKPFKTRKK